MNLRENSSGELLKVGQSEGLTFSHLAEEDGAEQEDGVEEKQAQTQPAVQLPAVQVDTRHLRAERPRLAG